MAEVSIARATTQILKSENGKWIPFISGGLASIMDLYFHPTRKTFRFVSYSKDKKLILNTYLNGSGAVTTSSSYKVSSSTFHTFNDHANRQMLGFNFSDPSKASEFGEMVLKVIQGKYLKEIEASSNPTATSKTVPEIPLPSLPTEVPTASPSISNDAPSTKPLATSNSIPTTNPNPSLMASIEEKEAASSTTTTSTTTPMNSATLSPSSPPPPPPPPPLPSFLQSPNPNTSSTSPTSSSSSSPSASGSIEPTAPSSSGFSSAIESAPNKNGPLPEKPPSLALPIPPPSASSASPTSPPPPPPPPPPPLLSSSSSSSSSTKLKSPTKASPTDSAPPKPKPAASGLTLMEEIALKASSRQKQTPNPSTSNPNLNSASVSPTESNKESMASPGMSSTIGLPPSPSELRVSKEMLDTWKQELKLVIHQEFEKLRDELRKEKSSQI